MPQPDIPTILGHLLSLKSPTLKYSFMIKMGQQWMKRIYNLLFVIVQEFAMIFLELSSLTHLG